MITSQLRGLELCVRLSTLGNAWRAWQSVGLLALWATCGECASGAPQSPDSRIELFSPDANVCLRLNCDDGELKFAVRAQQKRLIEPSRFGPDVAGLGWLGNSDIVGTARRQLREDFTSQWGKQRDVSSVCNTATVTLKHPSGYVWDVEMRVFNNAVAMRYRLPLPEGEDEIVVRSEGTQFRAAGAPRVLCNALNGFQTSHEAPYQLADLAQLPKNTLFDCPCVVEWPDGSAMAITEARLREFAGMYLEFQGDGTLGCRLSPSLDDARVAVQAKHSIVSPWRVCMLAESAGRLIENQVLLALNDEPESSFEWLEIGKTSFHWWNGDFENDYRLPTDQATETFVQRHRKYIDFCARYGIAFHAISGDGRPWYLPVGDNNYGVPSHDADPRKPRPELALPTILEYANEKGVGIRLWVHWRPLSRHLEECLSLYSKWGVKGLMVDFLDRDDQQMVEFTETLLRTAARHQLHIQIHGSSKYSGEQRTFPNLLNREGVLNQEYSKWSALCTPQHSVNVAYSRGLTGPVDYHSGGFRNVRQSEFVARNFAPQVMGSRCHSLALFMVYENPMPMLADSPDAYEGQPGLEFLAVVPTSWDETRFVIGDLGEYMCVARRSGDRWYIGGITNDEPRDIQVPMGFLKSGSWEAELWSDVREPAEPTELQRLTVPVDRDSQLTIHMRPGGGFVGEIRPEGALPATASPPNRSTSGGGFR